MQFELAIIPTPQARVRHSVTKNGFIKAYRSGVQVQNEIVLEALLVAYKPVTPIKGAVRLFFNAVLPIPQSVSKKKKKAMLEGFIYPTKKPDIDNLAKQILDAMTRLQFWEDDKQVVELYCKKSYGEKGMWVVEIEEKFH